MSSNAVLEIYESLDGALWVGTEGQGLNRLDPQREIWQIFVYDPSDPDSISNNEITAIAEDQSGVLWFGTGGGGLSNMIKTESDSFIIIPTQLIMMAQPTMKSLKYLQTGMGLYGLQHWAVG